MEILIWILKMKVKKSEDRRASQWAGHALARAAPCCRVLGMAVSGTSAKDRRTFLDS